MNFYRTKRNRTPKKQQINIIKAINGGYHGHKQQLDKKRCGRATSVSRHVDDFWKEIDERELIENHKSRRQQKKCSSEAQQCVVVGDDSECWDLSSITQGSEEDVHKTRPSRVRPIIYVEELLEPNHKIKRRYTTRRKPLAKRFFRWLIC